MVALQVTLFDVQQRTATADLSTPFIKYMVWSNDMSHVALLSKHAIIIANKRLGQASTGVSPPPSVTLLCAPPRAAHACEDTMLFAFAADSLQALPSISDGQWTI